MSPDSRYGLVSIYGLVAGPVSRAMAAHLVPGSPGEQPPGDVRMLRALVVGHDRGWRHELFERSFEVGAASDRVGIRLHPLEGPLGEGAVEVRSAPVATGTLQVPPSGEPVVLAVDHATHGGYPVGAVVISADLAELGRCRPGDRVRLVAVEPDEALDALDSLRRAVRDAPAGTHPTAAG